jgi:hypothetical protein
MDLITLLIGGGLLAFIQWAGDKVLDALGKKNKTVKAIEELGNQIHKLQHTVDEREAVLARTHILRFNDELINGIEHTHEYFLQTIDDIATYEKWCAMPENADFKNGRTIQAAENIHRTYDRLFEQGKFK